MKNFRKRAIFAAKVALTAVIVIGACWFVFRDFILEKALDKAKAKIDSDYNSTLTVREASFRGVAGIDMRGVSLVPNGADTLFRMDRISSDINMMQLLIGKVQLQRLDVADGYAQLVIRGKNRNFDAFLKKGDTLAVKQAEPQKKDYAREAYRMLSRALNLVPIDMRLSNISLTLDDNGKKTSVKFDNLKLIDKQLETAIHVQTSSFAQRWRIRGLADPRDREADVSFFNRDPGPIRVPYLDQRYNLKSSFDSVRISLKELDMDGDELRVKGFASIRDLVVNHEKIAARDVVIKDARFDYNLVFGPDFMRVDSSSVARLNKLKFHPFAEYNVKKDTIYTFKARIDRMPAQDFIESLPEGLFTNFEGMQATGNFDFHLTFQYNKNRPADIVLKSSLNKDDLRIVKYGAADLDMINGPFVYRAVDNGRLQRAVVVGPSNPNYTPLRSVTPLLRHSVLTSEDPSFYRHKGFINEAFKQSIVKNIKTKKFARGASTISMQLVKNVFLTREKTLSRKLEEILLVFVLENNRIVSKDRMLEVYFNIIEWGPNVYGIGEASYFYFQKHPSELSLRECLFLASIIPSPKRFMWQFNDDGELKSPYRRHQDRLTRLMFQRGLLTSNDTLYQLKSIMISGPARKHIRVKSEDVIKPDPEMDEFDF